MRGIDRLRGRGRPPVTQRGSLPIYLGTIMLVLVVLPGSVLLTLPTWPSSLRLWDTPGQVLVGATMIVAAVLAASSRGRLKAVILVGVTGYGAALMFLLHGAPDLALTQILVETVTLVVFVLVLRKLPKYFTDRPLHSSRWWRLVIALLVGLHRGRRRSTWPPGPGWPCRCRRPSTRRRTRSATARTSST